MSHKVFRDFGWMQFYWVWKPFVHWDFIRFFSTIFEDTNENLSDGMYCLSRVTCVLTSVFNLIICHMFVYRTPIMMSLVNPSHKWNHFPRIVIENVKAKNRKWNAEIVDEKKAHLVWCLLNDFFPFYILDKRQQQSLNRRSAHIIAQLVCWHVCAIHLKYWWEYEALAPESK